MTPSPVTLCLMVRDEKDYVCEWLAYHRSIGFDTIIVIDNESTDGTQDILQKLARAGLIELMAWRTRSDGYNQMMAYKAASSRVETEWLMFLDTDEFLVLHEDHEIGRFLHRFGPDVSLVGLNWRIFGTSGQATYYPDPVFLRFFLASPIGFDANRHLKYIVRTSRLIDPYVHCAKVSGGRIVNDRGEDLAITSHTWSEGVSHSRAQVNHYLLRSRAEFAAKAARPRVSLAHQANPVLPDAMQAGHFSFHDRNDEEDLSILRHLGGYPAQRRLINQVLAAE